MPEIPLNSQINSQTNSQIPEEEHHHKELTEEEKIKREEISDCMTMAISIITRGAYLIQLDQIRVIYILDEDIRTRIDSIIIDETEEMIDDINLFLPCDLLDYIDGDKFADFVEDLGYLDVNKAKVYGQQAFDIFSGAITSYAVSTWKY